MRLHLPRRRIWRITIYLISLLLMLIAADLILVQVRRNFSLGYDTTRIVSPVMPDGRVDYLSVLDEQAAEGVTPQNNAAVPFLQAVGRAGLSRTQPTDGITDKLGMPHLPEQGNYLVCYDDFIKQQDTIAAAPDLPTTWPATISPLTAQWVKANDHALELLTEASKRSRFFIPFDGGNRPQVIASVLLQHIKFFKEASRLLLMRAVIRLNAGDVPGFRDDLLAAYRLSRLLGQSPTAIERVTAVESLEIPACQIARVAAASGKLSAEQARSLAADLAAVGDLPSMSPTIDGERFMILDVLQTLATVPPDQGAELFNGIMGSDSLGPPNFLFRFAPLPYEAAMRHMNHCYDGALAAMQVPNYPSRIAAINLWQEENAKSSNRPFVFFILSSSFPTRQLLFWVGRMEQRQETGRTELLLSRIVLTLSAYKADHHGYPHSLDELSPAYLPIISNDPFSEKPLIYAATPTGYALRSVGPNMIDDGGTKDDIAVNGQ